MFEFLANSSIEQARRSRAVWRRKLAILVAVLVHFLIILPSLVRFSCANDTDVVHDRPLGLPGGSGDRIAKGTPGGVEGGKGNASGKQAAQVIRVRTNPDLFKQAGDIRRSRSPFMQRMNPDQLLAILKNNQDGGLVGTDGAALAQATLDNAAGELFGEAGPLGLPGGTGAGKTAAGSPFGNRVGAKLWLYRVKYDGDSWDANPAALPALLREVHKALNVPVSDSQQLIKLANLPNHKGANFPSLLFITGTDGVNASDTECKNLREYLTNGGLLVADSSGGSFEKQFTQFMHRVLPGSRFRNIEFDHPVFRGPMMPYQLTHGCPIYREHGSNEARGLFAEDGRLMVFLSPGDMGSAWAVTQLGKKRGTVEMAFQMGTNVVAYSLLTVHDLREK